MLAEFAMQIGDQFFQALAVPGHHLGQQQGAHGGVALRQIQFRPDAAAFLAAQQDVALQHAVADVFEADGRFQIPCGRISRRSWSIILVVEKVLATLPESLRVPARCQSRIAKI